MNAISGSKPLAGGAASEPTFSRTVGGFTTEYSATLAEMEQARQQQKDEQKADLQKEIAKKDAQSKQRIQETRFREPSFEELIRGNETLG